MSGQQNSRNGEGIFEPFQIDRVPTEVFAMGQRFASRFQQLGSFGGAAHVGVSMETLEPGKQACPAHYHMLEEEHLFILEGSLTLRLGDRTYEMAAGHYVCFPAGQQAAHALINNSPAPCRYLLIGERNPHDVIIYPDSGRVGVRLTGEGYRKSATMDYWDDQPT